MSVVRFAAPLIEGVLLRRYQRFFAEVRLPGGQVVLAHTPNTGRMQGCSEPGSPVFLSEAANPDRKLRYTLELVAAGDVLVGVNTLLPNRLVHAAVSAGAIPALRRYPIVQREVRLGQHSRIDLLLSSARGRRCYVEVKNVTLVEGGAALFPDAVTARGARHLVELEGAVAAGQRGVIFFLVQRADGRWLAPADRIDPAYGQALRRALARGVEALAYRAQVTPLAISLGRRIPLRLP